MPKKLAEQFLLLSLLVLTGCATAPTSVQPEDASSATAPTASESPVAAQPNSTEPNSSSQAASSTESDVDTTIVPGDRVGPITKETTREDLVRLFGEANLTDKAVPVGEGFTEPGTVVNLDEDRSFTIMWQDDKRNEIADIRNFGTAWKTPEGIGVGTPLSELQDKMGKFKLAGFGWDYGGTIVFKDTQLSKYDGLMVMRVQPRAGMAEQQEQAFKSVMGEDLYESTDPNLEKLDISVSEMIVYLKPYTP